MTSPHRDRLAGVLLGTAVGDALGLPREGLSAARAQAIFGDGLSHRLVLGRGMLSDDTEHTCLLAQSFLAADGDLSRFGSSLAWRLRLWALCLPAGIGFGTARAIAKLWIGFPASRSGVNSAGNGAAMRCGILGLLVEESALRPWVSVAARITHVDGRAEQGALLVALAVQHAASGRSPTEFLARGRAWVAEGHADWPELFRQLEQAVADLCSVREFAGRLGLANGVSGYVLHTVPIALFAWLRHADDFRAAIEAVVALGGDTDTVAAIPGAICGAQVGAGGIPRSWIDGLCDAPRSAAWLRALAVRLDENGRPLRLMWPLMPVRNVVFLGIVLVHGLRRLFPPYASRVARDAP